MTEPEWPNPAIAEALRTGRLDRTRLTEAEAENVRELWRLAADAARLVPTLQPLDPIQPEADTDE